MDQSLASRMAGTPQCLVPRLVTLGGLANGGSEKSFQGTLRARGLLAGSSLTTGVRQRIPMPLDHIRGAADRLAQSEHAEQPKDRKRCEQVLQCVAAHPVSGRDEDCMVKVFAYLRQAIQHERFDRIAASCIARWKQGDEEQKEKQRA